MVLEWPGEHDHGRTSRLIITQPRTRAPLRFRYAMACARACQRVPEFTLAHAERLETDWTICVQTRMGHHDEHVNTIQGEGAIDTPHV